MTNKHPDYKTTLGERFNYWIYFFGQNMFYYIVTYILATYMMMIGADLAAVSLIMLAVKVWDAVNDCLFGMIFDKVKFKNGSKCINWLRISVALIPLATILLFVIPKGASDVVKLAWFAVAYLIWDSAYTICDVPIYSMVLTMTDNMGERDKLMSYGRIFSGAGMAFTGLLCTVLVSEKVGIGFGTVAIIVSVMATLVMLPQCIKGKERCLSTQSEESYSFKDMFSYLRSNKKLLVYYFGFIINGCCATNGALGLFVSYYLFGSALFSVVLGILGSIPGMIAALLIPKMLTKIDKFKLFMICNVLQVVLGFVIFFAGYKDMMLFIVLTTLRAIPGSIVGVLNFMFTPDCAEYGAYKTGKNAKGITFAIQTFSAKITAAVSSSFGILLLSLFHWVEIEAESFADLQAQGVVQPESAIQGLWITYALIPVIGLVVSLVPYLFYKLNDKDVQIMARCNAGEISREEAEASLSRKY